MTIQLRKQTIAIHILQYTNISIHKSNQTMKQDQLTEYNTRNSHTFKEVEKLFANSVLKNQN